MIRICRRPVLLSQSLCIASLGLLTTQAEAIMIEIDYSYDTEDFFSSGSEERARLEDATGFFENLLEDDLDAITPTGEYQFFIPESWEVSFKNPSTGGTAYVADLAVPADTIILYVGAHNFASSFTPGIAQGGFGGYSPFVIPGSAFEMAINTRGESGVGTTDFAPWGGSLAVDTMTNWDNTLAGDGSNQHLYSTLLHEVGHVLGLGTSESWQHQTNLSDEFIGSEAVAEYGGNVPLDGDGNDHWEDGTMSYIRGTNTMQETALDPVIAAGTVKVFTDLDVAALDDIGWDIAAIPEPSMLSLLGLGCLLGLRRRS